MSMGFLTKRASDSGVDADHIDSFVFAACVRLVWTCMYVGAYNTVAWDTLCGAKCFFLVYKVLRAC